MTPERRREHVTFTRSSPLWRRTPAIATVGVMRWTTSVLSLVGGSGVLAAVTAHLGSQGADRRGITSVALVALAIGVTVALVGDRLTRASYQALGFAGTGLIGASVLFGRGGAPSIVLSVPFLFIVVSAFLLLPLGHALVQVAVVESVRAAALTWVGVPFAYVALLLCCTVGLSIALAWLVQTASAAEEDPLTGLASRRAFDRRLHEALQRAERTGGAVSVAVLDVDWFKHVNDARGHLAGDQLLVDCARAWSEPLPPGAVLARYGGDEFTLLLPGVSLGQAADVADGLRGRAPAGVTVSVGVAAWSPGDSGSVLVNRADVALYEAKTTGRDRTVAYGDPGRAASELETAIANGEMTLAYQPIVRLATGEIVGFEALARWQHPGRGLVMPDQFIPQAERTGAIRALGAWAVGEVCRSMAAGGEAQRRVSVNASAVELRSPGYAAMVISHLDAWSLPGSLLLLEITEGAFDDADGEVLANLAALRERGVVIAMDDFGSGYSSLRRLEQLPIDVIKLDGALLGGIRDDSHEAPILEAIVSMGRSLGVRLVAERVETAHQAQVLQRLGYDLGQGYHFGRPVLGGLPPASTGLERSVPC